MLNHVAFQAAQLPYGERSYENEVPEQKNSGSTRTIRENSNLTTFSSAGAGSTKANSEKVKAGLQWLNRDLDELVEQ